MKLFFDHSRGFGKMRDQLIYHAPYGAFFDPHEYDEALRTGWFPTNGPLWYQSRSTRIDLAIYQPSPSVLKLSKEIKFYPDVNMTPQKRDRLEQIYKKYLAYRDYKNQNFSIDEIIASSHGHIYYTHQSKIIAFMFFKTINKNFLAVEFGWDYENPKLGLGNVNIYYSAMLAKLKKCTHIYMSAGYESSSAYKANYKGFEWWTGLHWSSDVDKYKELCYDDDQVVLINFKHA